MKVYETVEGDVLDLVCWREYGEGYQCVVGHVLAANQGLAALGPVYPSGVMIVLPEVDTADLIMQKKPRIKVFVS